MRREIKDIFLKDVRVCARKKVLLRLDWNVPISSSGEPKDKERILRTLPLLEQLSLVGAITVVITHFGESEESLKPILPFVSSKLPFLKFIEGNSLTGIQAALEKAMPGDVFLLENIRMFDGEVGNSKFLAEELSRLASVYINDAFSVSHRKHASITMLPKYMLSYAGPLFEQEVNHLKEVLKPELPMLFIIGGAKISTKLDLIKNYLEKGAYVFVGGAMVHNIFKEINIEIGKSLYDEKYKVPQSIIENPRLLLPVDVTLDTGDSVDVHDVPKDGRIVDCGKLTVNFLSKHINDAKTVVMNGPIGLYEEGWNYGTEMLLSKMSVKENGKTIVGGGDTLAVLGGMEGKLKFWFTSLAGGAMLSYLTYGTLPGIDALTDDVTY